MKTILHFLLALAFGSSCWGYDGEGADVSCANFGMVFNNDALKRRIAIFCDLSCER